MSRVSSDVQLREPRIEDWPAILALADESVRAVAGAGHQDEWLRNRQRHLPLRRHFVAVEGAALVGYAAVEPRFDQVEGGCRLFVVAAPGRLSDIGALLYENIESVLAELRTMDAWFIEYASDQPLRAFLDERGFQEVRSFRLEGGVECVVLSKHLGSSA